jgi:hypothetical protein
MTGGNMPRYDSTERQRRALQQIHAKYGARCNHCGYDKDVRALQIDHVNGGGSAEIRGGHGAGLAYYLRVLNDTSGTYQILCANCNKIKRHANREALGWHQHRRASGRRPGDAARVLS